MNDFKGPVWTSVLEAALEDRLDFLRRLEARSMNYATEPEKAEWQVACYHAKLAICDIMGDLEKARES